MNFSSASWVREKNSFQGSAITTWASGWERTVCIGGAVYLLPLLTACWHWETPRDKHSDWNRPVVATVRYLSITIHWTHALHVLVRWHYGFMRKRPLHHRFWYTENAVIHAGCLSYFCLFQHPTFLPYYRISHLQPKIQVYGIIRGDEIYINQLGS